MEPRYRELAPPRGLEDHLACVWVSHDDAVLVLPDGCVDIVYDQGRLMVAGPATQPILTPPSPGQPRFGVRFRIGMAGAVLGLPAWELRDQTVELRDLWSQAGRRLEDRVAAAAHLTPDAAATHPTAGLAALIAGVAGRTLATQTCDGAVRPAVTAVLAGTPIHEVARRVGFGERQLRRRFLAAVGYGPATLLRVQRFQRFLGLAELEAEVSLARLAADSGYADQAHLARECRRLSGLPPGALLSGGPTAAGERALLTAPPRA